jgi:hypothetical protein
MKPKEVSLLSRGRVGVECEDGRNGRFARFTPIFDPPALEPSYQEGHNALAIPHISALLEQMVAYQARAERFCLLAGRTRL